MTAGLADQALSSGSNALVLVALARSSSVSEFGRASLAILAMTALLGVTRGLVGTHLTMLAGRPTALMREARSALALGILIGAIVTIVSIATCVLWRLPPTIWILAGSPIAIVIQDTLRYVSVAAGKPRPAVVSDGVWFTGSLVGVGLTAASPAAPPAVVMLVWVSSAVVSAVLLWNALPLRPRFAGMAAWIRRDSGNRWSFGAEGVISSLSSVAVLAIVTASLGLPATAAIRGAGTVIGPLSLLMGALPLVLVPELTRSGVAGGGARLWHRIKWVGLGICVLALAVGSVGLWLPHEIGLAVLGATWSSAKRVLPIVGVEYAFLAWMHVASTGLRALSAGRRLLLVRSSFAVASVAGIALACQLGDVVYVSAALALIAAVWATACVVMLRTTSGTGTLDAQQQTG